MSELSDAVKRLQERLADFARNVQIDQKRRRVTDMEARMSEPTFWNDQALAKKIIAELKPLKNVLDPYTALASEVETCAGLAEMAEAEKDEATMGELLAETRGLDSRIDQLEIRLALSGPYDINNVFLSIQAGVGGTDANDWAEMLWRMYTNYCQKRGWSCTLLDHQPATEAGIRSATMKIDGEYAYGYLKSEMGTHRLVRMSPFNAGGTRETSFAAVEVTPELEEQGELELEDLDEKEFRIDTYRASGSGGQHVNKTDSAVRITHLKTGMVTSCQSERSQPQNKHQAWKMMVAKLQQLREAERLQELKDLSGDKGTIGWGHQIRSYFIHPTQIVTDLRTRHKENNAQKVLDGDLQEFIDAYLVWRLKGMVK